MYLFLSPHLDDAVLSCGGTIHQLTARGETVMVLTTMAGDPPEPLPDTPIIADLHQRWQAGFNPVSARRAEDQRACGLLGAQVLHLDLGDCVYRVAHQAGKTLALYPTEESLWGPVRPDDPAVMSLRSTTIPPASVVVVPLGNRHHVDHRIVRDWGLWLSQQSPALSLRFYEEYPPEIDATMELEQALTYYQDRTMQPDVRPLTEADVAAKLRAVACYESQISTFWASAAEMEVETRASMTAAGDGNPVERFWRMV
ncbi:MAG: PIG-L family deacetylase [Anaerolineae bacterium]|nr:PIG-L family deacetylase [Anaerolineae bacterium]